MRASAAPAPPGGRLKLTPEGLAWFAAAGVLGLLGWSKSLNLLLMLAYVMLVLLALNGVQARKHANRFRARRSLPPPLFAGESAELQTVLENGAARSACVQVKDRERTWTVADLVSGSTASFQTFESFPARGRIALPPLMAGSAYPFGLLEYSRPDSPADAVIVLPALGRADPEGLRRWLLRAAGGEGRSRKVLRRVTHDAADVRGIRPYRQGDSLRAVHWKSSARRRELMVREYDAAPSPELLLVVEAWLPVEPTERDRVNLEAALSLAATIAYTWCHDMDARAILVVGSSTTVATESTLREALRPLAEAGGSDDPPPPVAESFGRAAGRAARLIVSSRPQTPLAGALARELGKPFIVLDSIEIPAWYQAPRGKP